VPHDERDDYADDPFRPFGRIDRLFATIEPIHFILLALVPCWWPFAPAFLGWAALGLLVCRHPLARRNAIILLVIAIGQFVAVGLYLAHDFVTRVVRP
jgi:hypothetical protein